MALARRQSTGCRPLWSGAGEVTTKAHAPDSSPSTSERYARTTRRDDPSPASSASVTSPSSSEESCSPLAAHSYRRLGGGGGERAPLMRRLARGFATSHRADDDSVPLVTDTPTTPTNPLRLNEGYANEASSEDGVRARESNRETGTRSPPPVAPRRLDRPRNDVDEEFKTPMRRYDRRDASGDDDETEALRDAPWFQAGIPREIALEVLERRPVGAFLVRCSSSAAGVFALSLRVPRRFHPRGVAHYLIQRHGDKYRIKGFTKEFSSLAALVTHHSVMPELLPCPLRVARYTNDDRHHLAGHGPPSH